MEGTEIKKQLSGVATLMLSPVSNRRLNHDALYASLSFDFKTYKNNGKKKINRIIVNIY